MPNEFSVEHMNFLLVFLEGVLSFFSPCVLPLLPVYISYLAGNAKRTLEDGSVIYQRKKVFLHTVCFVLGISAAFFLLGLSFSALGSFFNNYKTWFTKIGGILIVLLGLFQLGVFDFAFLQKERKIHFSLAGKQVNPLLAFVMGFTFSFAWTPCVGPALSSVLILASSAKSAVVGNLLVLVYAVGFVIPFLLVGLFTTQVLNFLRSKQKFLKYTIKAGGILLVVIGVMTFTGWMNGVSGYLTSFSLSGNPSGSESSAVTETSSSEEASSENSEGTQTSEGGSSQEEKDLIPAFDFTLKDQYGEEHTLSDYKGKVVFLNFWTTWCTYCKQEMPDMEELYHEYGENTGDVIFLGVANPSTQENQKNADVSPEEIQAFLEENGYTFPVVFDETGDVLRDYYVNSFPMTYLITKSGEIYGYVPGMMTKSTMESVIEMALDE